MTSNERSSDRCRLLFPVGALIFSEGIDRLMRDGRLDPMPYFQRHIRGDWGDLDDSDWQSNDTALRTGEDRLFSSYQVEPDLKLWIITEWDRSVTTLLLPNEY
ncbi:TPA: hypothetical protein G8N70_003077 [Salmonella enterica]|uniref:Type I restriction endonuclease subunit M n=1 Tax=Salmonella enterica TaxID=28901 RepID=A0A744HDP3_SALER|nr:hypothetical protein [Salmonella enterica]HAF4919932.1 hypothetical protein [Salmonella enterica]